MCFVLDFVVFIPPSSIHHKSPRPIDRNRGTAAAAATVQGAGPYGRVAAESSRVLVNGEESVVSSAGACFVVVAAVFVVTVDVVVSFLSAVVVSAAIVVDVVGASEVVSDEVEVVDEDDVEVAPAFGTVLVDLACAVCVLRYTVVVACVVTVVAPVGVAPKTMDTKLLADDSAALILLAGTLCLSAAQTSDTTSKNCESMASITLLAVATLLSPLLSKQKLATQDTTLSRNADWADSRQTQLVLEAPQPLWLTQTPRQPVKAT